MKKILRLALKTLSLALFAVLDIASLIFGFGSLLVSFFVFKPKLIVPRLIQIFLPFTLFGRFWCRLMYFVFSLARKKHCHVLAGTGSGKSFLILHLIYRDILRGYGLAVIEPHSQLVNHVLHLKILQLGHKRQYCQKIVLLDFEDPNPPALNLFAIPLPKERDRREMQINAVVQNYMEAFEKAFYEMPLGVRRVLKNTLIALFDLPGATILDVLDVLKTRNSLPNRYARLFESLENPILKRYFERDFFNSRSEISKDVLRIRIEALLVDRQVRLALTRTGNALNVDQVLREGKILLVKAGETIGQETARFLGALIHQLLLFGGFKRVPERYKRPFSVYLDECQNYMSQDVTKGLDEARKAGIQYLLSHQRSRQRGMTYEQQRALDGCAVRIYGKMEYFDAFRLSKQLSMGKEHLRFVNLRVGEFYAKVGTLKTRFVKFPRYLAPDPGKIGRIEHRYFAKTEQVRKLTKWLKGKSRSFSASPKADSGKKSKSPSFFLHDDF